MDQEANADSPAAPQDARKTTEEQRKLQEQLEHQHEDPHAPGLHQSRHDTPTRPLDRITDNC